MPPGEVADVVAPDGSHLRVARALPDPCALPLPSTQNVEPGKRGILRLVLYLAQHLGFWYSASGAEARGVVAGGQRIRVVCPESNN